MLAVGLLVIAALPGFAIDVVRLHLGTLEGPGWSARALILQLNWLDERHAGLVLQAQNVALPEGLGELSAVTLSCARAQLTATQASCAQGTLKAQSSVLGRQNIQTSFRYRFDTGRIDTELQGLHVYDGTLAITANLADTHWQINARGAALSLPAITRQLAAAGLQYPLLKAAVDWI